MKLGRYKTVLGYGTKACCTQSQFEGHTLLYELLIKVTGTNHCSA